MPDTHAVTFRADSRQLLTADEFALVDADWQAGRTDAAALLADDNRRQHPDRLYRLAGRTFAEHQSPDQILARMRGHQAAAFLADWNLDIDPHRLRPAAAHHSRAATLTPTDRARLRRYQRTEPGAIAALRLAGVANDQLAHIRVQDVAADASTVTIGDTDNNDDLPVPDTTRPFLLAQRLYTLGDNPDPGRYLLYPNRHRDTARPRCLQWANQIHQDIGVAVAPPDTHPAHDAAIGSRRWAEHAGITIRALRRFPPRP